MAGTRRRPGAKLWFRGLRNLEAALEHYETVIVPENNTGQLKMLLQGRFLKPIIGINEMKGRAFHVHELREYIREHLDGGGS